MVNKNFFKRNRQLASLDIVFGNGGAFADRFTHLFLIFWFSSIFGLFEKK